MLCPKCKTKLETKLLDDSNYIEIDFCNKCHGAWFEKGELDRADDSIWVNIEKLETSECPATEKYLCPACQCEMASIRFLNIETLEVEKCKRCNGYWVDRGELAKIREIAAYIDSVASEPSDNRMKKYMSLARKDISKQEKISIQRMPIENLNRKAMKFLKSIYKKQQGQLSLAREKDGELSISNTDEGNLGISED